MTDDRWVDDEIRRCRDCGGLISRRTNVAAPRGKADRTYPWVHINQADWQNRPHNAEPREDEN